MQEILDDFRKGEKMNKKVYCEICGEEFQARNSNHKCCDNCSQKSIVSEHLRICKICGGKSNAIMSKEFAPNAKRQIRDGRRKHLTTLWFFLSLKDVLTMPNTEQNIVTECTEHIRREVGYK